jgi:serine/threonine protein kinase/tetratricopeptide (TPR) repeat protein
MLEIVSIPLPETLPVYNRCSMVGTTLSHYRITAKLGEGGMGEVYLARDTKLDREVALKVLPREMAQDPERLRRLQREARALASLDHPGIVTIFSVEEADGVHFLTMARVQGQTLAELIPPEGLPVEQLLDLGTALADALRAAHEQGIVHRDLKPSNVMVDGEGRPRVLDFGLSRTVEAVPLSSQMATQTMDEPLTRHGVVLGTVPYMSPEQAEGRPVGPASDLFSLGAVLYEMATGRRPFHGDSSASLVSAILRDRPPAISELRSDLPASLAKVIERCLEKSPDRRYESAEALRDDLEALRREALFGESVPGAPVPSQHPRAAPWAWLAAIAVLVALVAAVTWVRQKQPGRTVSEAERGSAVAESIRSIAVLPMLNLSGDPQQEYFSDGMTEALIQSLAQVSTLTVISRTSSMRFKSSDLTLPEIARSLGVDAVVEGSVQREADTVRVTAQLVDATDRQLWGDTFEQAMTGALQLQSQVARSIAQSVAATVSAEDLEPAAGANEVNPEAYEAYLRGKHFLAKGTAEGLQKGMAMLQQAVDLDPVDPLAYAGLANGYVMLAHATGDADYARRAKAAAQRALEFDETNAEAQAALAMVAMFFDWEWQAAEIAFRSAIEANPSNAEVHSYFGFLHLVQGDFEPAVAEVELARELDPLSPSVSVWAAELYWPFGLYERAEEAARTALELNPDFPHAHAWLAQAYLGQERLDEALEHARIAAAGGPRWMPYLGTVLVKLGQREEASALLEELLATLDGRMKIEVAYFQAAFGDLEGAMATLERAYEAREVFVPWIGSWAEFGELAADPRFRDLLARIPIEYVRPQLLAAARGMD